MAFQPNESGGTYCGMGVEISFPTHHSITNVRPREYRTCAHPDGSATIVMGELELRMRMRWEVHLTLRPGAARLEQKIRVHNRTAMYGRGRYWGNAGFLQKPGMVVSYPEQRAYEHGGEYGIASWPIYDGVDMRDPQNCPFPIGLKMKDVRDGFYACYYPDDAFGMVHWDPADEAPAKKYWTWGRSVHREHRAQWFGGGEDFLELQSGRVEDQEEYELYPPFCMKRWREVWYPVRDIGPVDAAGEDAALSCTTRNDGAEIRVFAAVSHPVAQLLVFDDAGKEVARRKVCLAAGQSSSFAMSFTSSGKVFRVELRADNRSLTTLMYRHELAEDIAVNRVSKLKPGDIPITADDHMMAYERALDHRRQPWTSFEELLKKVLDTNPDHQAANRWLGIWLVRRGLYSQAEGCLDKALARCAHDGDAHFYKGVCRSKPTPNQKGLAISHRPKHAKSTSRHPSSNIPARCTFTSPAGRFVAGLHDISQFRVEREREAFPCITTFWQVCSNCVGFF